MNHNPLDALFGAGDAVPAADRVAATPPEEAGGTPAVLEQDAAAPQPPNSDGSPSAEAVEDKPVSEAGESEAPLNRRELAGILSATLAEREKRQAAETRLAEAQARLAQLEAKGDPPAAAAAAAEPTAEQRLAEKVVRLEAEVRHGAEAVKAAFDWAVTRCDEDPLFNAKAHALIQHLGSPYEAAVRLRAEQDELDALRAKADVPTEARSEPAAAAPDAAAAPPSPPPPPPRSLADAPNAGGHGRTEVPIGPGEAFRAAIR